MATDTITYQTASEIDTAWSDARWPSDGLRIVPLKNSALVTVPNNENAPRYNWHSHNPVTGEFAPAFYHVSGPTLAQWYEQQDAADLRDTQRCAF